ncbi:MAG: hypothetical protein WHS90_16255 [Caldilinea sp.]|uniref:hypothetical protein n=1 Tax=Caldilinea sp. TaxID=2293560 RepID=UPI0030B4F662
MKIRCILILGLLVSLIGNLFPVAAFAQDVASSTGRAELSVYGVRCKDSQCFLTVNASGLRAEVAVPAANPLRFDLPVSALGGLSGARVEISDQLTLSLPVGVLQMRNSDFLIGVDATGKVQRLRGKAETVLPSLTLPNNLRIGGAFAAEFGYDYGAELDAAGRLLNAEDRYFYMRLGEGLTLDATLLDESGAATPITLGLPEGESTTIIVDPENQLLYLDGRFNVAQAVRLALVATTLGIDAGQLPMLTGVALPLRSTVGVAALFSHDPERNFVQLNTDLSIEGGPLAELLRLQEAPLALDSTVRIDRRGLLVQGLVDARVAPKTLLETGGMVEFFVPFQRLRDAYVRLGGNLAAPILGVATENELVLQAPEDATLSPETLADAQLPWWNTATAWIGDAASSAAIAVAEGTQVSVDAVQSAVDATLRSAGAATPSPPTVDVGASTGAAISGAVDSAACGLLRAQQLWCKSTGLCEPPADDPACRGESD